MDGENLLTRFDEMVKKFRQEFSEIVESEIAKIKAEFEAYKAEKERIEAVNVRDDDLINLNVGGTKLTTTRSTLCQVEDSLLAALFSGRWEDNIKARSRWRRILRLQSATFYFGFGLSSSEEN